LSGTDHVVSPVPEFDLHPAKGWLLRVVPERFMAESVQSTVAGEMAILRHFSLFPIRYFRSPDPPIPRIPGPDPPAPIPPVLPTLADRLVGIRGEDLRYCSPRPDRDPDPDPEIDCTGRKKWTGLSAGIEFSR